MNPTQNQGEGDKISARRYNEEATEHAHRADVEAEAREAAAALDAAPEAHREAELAGKFRISEEDPAVTRPTWWTVQHQTAWERFKSALSRDWKQTLSHLTGGKAGTDLDQSIADTVRQILGRQPMPPEGEPVGIKHDLDWDRAMAATSIGYAAADHYGEDWGPQLEDKIRRDWSRPESEWEQLRTHVYVGWRMRRRLQ